MDRLRFAFAALLVLSVSLAGATAVDEGNRLQAIDAVRVVEPRVAVDVTDVALGERSLAVSVWIRNPTRLRLELRGARFRLSNETNERLASGAGTRLDDAGSTVPADGSLRVTYAVGLPDDRREHVRGALERGATLSMNFAMHLGDANFVLRREADVDLRGR